MVKIPASTLRRIKDMMRKRRSPGRSIGPAGASTVSKDGKRMKTTKKPTAKQKQLEKLKDMRDRVMGTQKVMVAKRGGAASNRAKQFLEEGRKKQKNKIGKPKGKGIFGAAAKLPGTMAASGIKAAARKFKSTAEKMRLQKGRKAGLSRALSKLGGAGAKAGAGAAAKAFKKARERKPGGRLTADDLRRATRRR